MARDVNAIWSLFRPLWSDIGPEQNFFEQRPLLAHYTSMATLEKIATNNEIWLANPLFMNDIEEVRFGINEGTWSFVQNEAIKRTLGPAFQVFEEAIWRAHSWFDSQHAFDTYILCLSQHDEGDRDGLLSMWRGYGDGGKGVAVVFDARTLAEAKNTPLIISKVMYGTTEQRVQWFERTADTFSSLIGEHAIVPEELPFAASALFARLRSFSLFAKHVGFQEEREWRLAYQPELDMAGSLKKHLSYFNGPRGVEPKLKLPVQPTPELGDGAPLSLETLIHSIILGPSLSTPLALASAKRMLVSLGHPQLADRVVASRIPYRPT